MLIKEIISILFIAVFATASAKPVLEVPFNRLSQRDTSSFTKRDDTNIYNIDVQNITRSFGFKAKIGTPGETVEFIFSGSHNGILISSKNNIACNSIDPDKLEDYADKCAVTNYDPSKSSSVKYDKEHPLNSESVAGIGYYLFDFSTALSDTWEIGEKKINDVKMAISEYTTLPVNIIGLGVDRPKRNTTLPTFQEILVDQKVTKSSVYSVYFNNSDYTGDILFGGIDKSKFTGNLTKFKMYDDTDSKLSEPFVVFESLKVNGSVELNDEELFARVSPWHVYTHIPALATDIVSEFNIPEDIVEKYGKFYYLPCDAKTGITLDFKLQGMNALKIPLESFLSDTAYHSEYLDKDMCEINLETTPYGDPLILGESVFKHIYAVFDFDNQELAIAPKNNNPGQTRQYEVIESSIPGPDPIAAYPNAKTFITSNNRIYGTPTPYAPLTSTTTTTTVTTSTTSNIEKRETMGPSNSAADLKANTYILIVPVILALITSF